jgi:hypothetical protein
LLLENAVKEVTKLGGEVGGSNGDEGERGVGASTVGLVAVRLELVLQRLKVD